MPKAGTRVEDDWYHQQRQRLQGRWRTDAAQMILAQVIAALQAKQPWAYLVETLPEVEDVYDRRDLRGAPLAGAVLAGTDLQSAKLSFADLAGADLSGANLSGAELDSADLSRANLRGADLTGNFLMGHINLAGADLTRAEMSYSTLASADLTGTNFTQAQLDHAIFLGVKKDGTIFDGASLHKTEFREYASETR